ncbi:MAG: DNA-3-methyladenine glycosylase family protein [Candidatus Heimdallarchaeota archaeon]
MNSAIEFLKKDKALKRIIEKDGEIELSKNKDYFESLVEAIIYQQISWKAAKTIFEKYKKLFPKGKVTPAEHRKLKEDDLQAAGVSKQKRAYCYNLSEKFIDKSINPEKFEQMTDEEIITDLIQTKGIGRWTAQMFLIFSLAREDIFAPDDLGLRRAVMLIYGFSELPSIKELEKFSYRWQPYRTYASLYLWRYAREH